MADIGYPELAEGIGVQTGDTLLDIANTAADFLCDAYQTAADAIIGGPLDNPGARFADGLARRICAPRNKLPPDPITPPSGGQCECQRYLVTARAVGNTDVGQYTTASLDGPIGGPIARVVGDRTEAGFFYGSAACGGRRFFAVVNVATVVNNVQKYKCEIQSIVPDGAFPDNCGNLPPQYESRVPSLDDLKSTRPWPIPGVNIPVDVEITPVKFEPGINIKPEFNINVGGIQVKFDITGAKINIGPQFNFPPQLPPSKDPRVPPPTPEPIKDPTEQLDNLSGKLDDIFNELEDIKKCACKIDKPLLTQLFSESTGSVITLPERCKFVKVELTVISSNAKVEFGNGNTPDVYYAGWCCFVVPGGFSQRQQLQWQSATFDVPSKATGFSYTVRKGYNAQVVAYYEPPDE